IHDNVGLGIDLGGNGVTPNDTGDPHDAPNNGQNFPLLGSAISSGGSTTVQVGLNSIASLPFFIDFYVNDASDPAEGKSYLGSQLVTTDASGNANFSAVFPIALSSSQFVTATATRGDIAPAGDTSEFSQPVAVMTPAAP